MNQLNENATTIFCQLLNRLGNELHLKLYAEGFMPLVIERLEDNILTPLGVGVTYSLCHYYEQNGDLMRDPEMVFIVVDNRNEENNIESVHIIPQLFLLDNIGLYEESVSIENGQIKSIRKHWQEQQCSFANFWLPNIAQEGFLNE